MQLNMQFNSFKELVIGGSLLINETMNQLLPENYNESRIIEAMRYSALSQGKLIRPLLLIACANIYGLPLIKSLRIASAVEFVHVYSLIHDDLPAMDNDDYRRGKLSNHKQFNEATAILAGDALLTLAFEIISNPLTHNNVNIRCELILILSQAIGYKGMIGGQMIDIENINKKISNEQIANLHRLKTGELFKACAHMGALIGNATNDEINALKYFAHDLGLAFQIKDDIIDHQGINFGKVGIDEINHKKIQENASIVDVVGKETAIKQLNLLKQQTKDHLKIFGNKAKILIELTDHIIG